MHYPFDIYLKALQEEFNIENPSLHYGLIEDDNTSYKDFQVNSNNMILGRVISNMNIDKPILEVGIGMGHLMSQLVYMDYDVIGICPDKEQIDNTKEYIYNRYPTKKLNLECVSFENYSSYAQFGGIIFQESAQYINPMDIINKSAALLGEGGKLIVVDEFSTELLPQIKVFAEEKFRILEEIDLTIKASPSISILIKAIENHRNTLVPYITSSSSLEELLIRLRIRENEYKTGSYKYMFYTAEKK